MKSRMCLLRILTIGLVISSLALLSGCGEVVVFGHTVREGQHSSETESKPDTTPDSQSPQSVASVESAKPAATSQSQSYEKQPAKPALRQVNLMPVVLTPQIAAQIKDDPKFNIGDL